MSLEVVVDLQVFIGAVFIKILQNTEFVVDGSQLSGPYLDGERFCPHICTNVSG